jgi:hypothetical protein
MTRRASRHRGVVWGVAVIALFPVTASGQRVETERPRTLVVGTPAGSRTDQANAARTGLVPALPGTGGLRIAWRTSIGAAIDRAPLVDARGGTYLVGTRGEVVALTPDGVERWRVATGAGQPGPPALLSDDTVVFVDLAGDAIAVRDGSVRWRSRVGRADAVTPSPLPLDDGGVVVATTRDLAVLDSEGVERARTTLPEATTSALVSALGKVIAVSVTGTVWTWSPGAPAPTLAASFGSPVDGSAALADEHTLIGVTAGRTTLTTVDLARGTTATRAVSRRGAWRGPPAMLDGVACLVLFAPGSEQAVAVDAAGQEVGRAILVAHAAGIGPLGVAGAADAGAAVPTSAAGSVVPTVPTAPIVPPLVDRSGALAFATLEGGVGVVAGLARAPTSGPGATGGSVGISTGASVELVRSACAAPFGTALGATTPSVAGLAALPDAAVLVACHSGVVLALTSGERPSRNL